MELSIGNKIKKLREYRGYSQDYMAKKLNISQEQYSYLENRQKQIPDSTIEDISKLLDFSKEEIFNFKSENFIKNYFSDSSTGCFNITTLIIECHEHERKAYHELISVLRKEIEELKNKQQPNT
ncbi:MAG: helix-turn-helix transcriptional regulator [Chitinophagaceae bacterium]